MGRVGFDSNNARRFSMLLDDGPAFARQVVCPEANLDFDHSLALGGFSFGKPCHVFFIAISFPKINQDEMQCVAQSTRRLKVQVSWFYISEPMSATNEPNTDWPPMPSKIQPLPNTACTDLGNRKSWYRNLVPDAAHDFL